jgi:hypothetical protein
MSLEPISTRPGPTGTDSDRIKAIVANFVVRGFVQDFSPYVATERGKKWLELRLKQFAPTQDPQEVFSVIDRSLADL